MGVGHRMYYGETNIDFVGKARRSFLLSGVILLAGLISLIFQGLNFGIEFQGGTAWEMSNVHVTVDEARSALRPLGLGDSTIQLIGGDTLRVQAEPEKEETVGKVRDALAKVADIKPEQVSISEIGPSWGKAITQKAERALFLFFLAIALYISFRFEWKMAVTALLALLHDILLTVGVYSLSGFEVTPVTVIAFLTIMGFSLYDSIIVFDKIDENTRGLAASGRLTYSATVNLSTNQMLMRSVNTSTVAILPIMSVLFVGAFILGATTLQDFGLSMLVGMAAGMYSSLFFVPPVLSWLKEREPRYSAIRKRLATRGEGAAGPLTPAAARVASVRATDQVEAQTEADKAGIATTEVQDLNLDAGESSTPVAAPVPPAANVNRVTPPPAAITPRGRKKKRRR
ncbi:MAG TPA: protein translocase subunit SecF [Acidimicrobiales bacterium]|nr:protein translocase subunit SecF [Acidimicrobiales bacterium]